MGVWGYIVGTIEVNMPLSRSAGMLLLPVGCFCSASGLLLMKAAGDSRPDLPPWRNPKWIAGFVLLGILATVVEVAVLGVLPLSVVAPFAGLTIAFSLLLAASGLLTSPAERLERADLACIALVLLGVTLVSTFGPHEESAPSLPALLAAYTRPRFALFAAAALITAALVLSKSVCGVSDKSSVLPLISAFAAAATGCISQLMLKVVSTTASAFPATAVPLALALLGLCVSAPLHLTLLNRTLVGAAVALAVPAYQFLLIVCTTSAGGILLDEFESLSSGDLWAYACGVVTATVGLVGLSYFSSVGAEPGGDEEGSSDESDKAALELERGAEGGSGHSGSTSSDAAESATSLPPRPMLSQLRGDRTQGSILRGRLSRKSLTSGRHSLVVGSFGAGLGSVAAISDLRLSLSPKLSQSRPNTWSTGLSIDAVSDERFLEPYEKVPDGRTCGFSMTTRDVVSSFC
ncbi:hypothetical protein EMIHUDRAFT_234474 [Emiliania huxleyi CCMP1516]|uniref:EamA domain-containing protein n=2 Tax=Emiliania huxleyi TaxID=2903 RepID=A0A0D3JZ79_EMIH1|nr:hypothetical protein EMIHUDRAFT_234474 [Emiliania huxleyi CCMP1516]EOD28814.1 hypothetical protein EMIHUDRAFT_234474 [Emiliania huxleyi CCMP1516]|eukprot:XP_005781243.1 hypothetical protein EMIHUDRAFT_234474 [Emiliania huxleyi CCMP1516]